MLFAEWRLILTGPADGSVNMAIDEATLTLVSERRAPPTVRIYYWESPCYSIGYLQETSARWRASLRSRCKQVRRLTGGNLHLHGGDLSYSLVVPLTDTLVPSSVLASYERISFAVIEGLRLMGFDARFVPPTEVQIDGHVIATAAQARKQGVLLQQGSVALNRCAVRGKPQRACLAMTPLSELVGSQIDFEDAARALAMGFRRALGVDLSPGILFAREKRLARQFLREKYSNSAWTYSR